MNKEIIWSELEFKHAKGSGPGGQHVNKTASKVILKFNVKQSKAFNSSEKERLLTQWQKKLNNDGALVLSSHANRSQLQNKTVVIKQLFNLLAKALHQPKLRIATKPSKAVKAKRLQSKKQQAEKKLRRTKPKFE